MDGSDEERHLLNALGALGWAGVRAPASGTGDHEQPDILVAMGGVVLAAELKSGKRPKNIQDDEMRALTHVGEAFAAAVVAAVRYKGDRTFYLVPRDDLTRTPSGHYSIPGKPANLPWAVGIEFSPPAVSGDGYDAHLMLSNAILERLAAADDPLKSWAASTAWNQMVDGGRLEDDRDITDRDRRDAEENGRFGHR